MASKKAELPSAAVVICCYTQQRWRDLLQAIESVRRQTVAPNRLVVVVDHNQGLLADLAAEYPTIAVVANRFRQGLSGARNTGVAECDEDVVAFLDDDATAAPDWLETLLGEYRVGDTIAAGGYIEPAWDGGNPGWFPAEFGWVVGCSYRGQPVQRAVVRNVIGANMSFRRSAVLAAGGFGEQLGRVGASAAGCEETELCLRAARHTGGSVGVFSHALAYATTYRWTEHASGTSVSAATPRAARRQRWPERPAQPMRSARNGVTCSAA